MYRNKPFSAALALTLTLMQILLCVLPTISFSQVQTDGDYADIDTYATSQLSVLTSFYQQISSLSDIEEELEYSDDDDDDYYSYDNDEKEEGISIGSYYTAIIFIMGTMLLALLFFALAIHRDDDLKRYQLYLALSATTFVLSMLITLIVDDSFISEYLSKRTRLDSGLTLFGIMSLIGMGIQWILFFCQNDSVYASYPTSTAVPARPVITEPTYPASTTSYVPFSNPVPAPQPPQSRVKSTTNPLPRKDEPEKSEVCKACGTKVPASCRYCYTCGADMHEQSKDN